MAKKSLRNLMMLLLSVSLVIGALLTGGCVGKETETPTPEIPTQIIESITPQDAFTLIQENKDTPPIIQWRLHLRETENG